MARREIILLPAQKLYSGARACQLHHAPLGARSIWWRPMKRWRYRLLQEFYSTLDVEPRRWLTLFAFAAFAYLHYYYAGVLLTIGRF
jgi:hypothetical protein